MKKTRFKSIQKKLKHEIDEARYEHTMGVMYTCGSLAMRYGYDIETAMLAGLLHDCAKCIPNPKKLKICDKNGISYTDTEKRNPFLLHAKLGAFIARTEYGIDDSEVLSSIEWHTTGKPNMSLLDKIVYIADYIEPGRDKAPNLAEVRKLAFMDLDQCLYKILCDTLEYLENGNGEMDEMTRQAYEYYHSQFSKVKDED